MWIFWGSSQYWTSFRGLFKYLGSMCRTRIIFGVAKISNIFGVLDIPEFFYLGGGGGVNGRCWAQAYV